MPLVDLAPEGVPELYPSSEDAHQKLLTEAQRSFIAAQAAQQPHRDRWIRYYRLFRSYAKRQTGDWHSKVFIPLCFFTVQTILPRLVAQLPRAVVYPVGPEDAPGAPKMEELLSWAADQSELYLEQVKAYHSALVYGTGILKTRAMKDTHHRIRLVPVMEERRLSFPQPVIDPETGRQMLDVNSAPMFEQAEISLPPTPTGKTRRETEEVVSYVGPVGEALDIFNFFPAPEATSIDDARFVIQRRLVPQSYVERMFKEGLWRRPDHMADTELWPASDDPAAERLSEVELDGGAISDPTRRLSEVWEWWRDDETVATILNQRAIVRVSPNPYDHGEMPFVRIVDHLNPHEFWGTGEIEHLEGIQDALNATWNQRIDNVRLVTNAMFLVDEDAVTDTRELRSRPGGVVRVHNKNGYPLDQVIQRVDFGSITSEAYTEAAELERMAEKISGVSAYQTGADSPSLNDTATGVALISEQGNTRFAHKVRIAEMTGLKRLMRQYGAILQQFTPPEFQMRIIGSDGRVNFQPVSADALESAFDYDIEAESSTVTESVRKQQSMTLLQVLAQTERVNVPALIEDVLRDFGKKDLDRYILPEPQMPLAQEELPPELAGLMGGGAPEQMGVAS